MGVYAHPFEQAIIFELLAFAHDYVSENRVIALKKTFFETFCQPDVLHQVIKIFKAVRTMKFIRSDTELVTNICQYMVLNCRWQWISEPFPGDL